MNMNKATLYHLLFWLFGAIAFACIYLDGGSLKIAVLIGLTFWAHIQIEKHEKPTKRRVIVCAANKLASGLIVCGARHHDAFMNAQIKAAGDTHVGEIQGFIDNKGNFLTREEAHKIAYWNRQRKYRCGGDKKTLFSENLY